MLEVQMIK